jgi:cytochrome P450
MAEHLSGTSAGYWAPQCPAGAHDDPEHLRDHFDPLSDTLTRGRYLRVAGTMARTCPVTRTDGFGDGIWTVSGYAELQELHRVEDRFSAHPVLLQNFGNTRPMIPMESDPPLHRQYKQIIAPLLSRAVQADKEPTYRATARDLVDRFLDRGRCEIFGELCNPLTAHALMDALGVPGPDRERLADLAVALVRGRAEGGTQADEIYEYFTDLAADKRREPADDIVSRLTTATVEGRPLTEEEILDYCVILLPAGFETTASSMSFVFLLLAEHPDLQDELRAAPERIPDALEELMRFATPTRSHTRTVLTDTVIGGRELRAGERVYLNWAGANHDPRTFARPEELQVDRRPNRHMAYGFGAHICVGMHMARAELKVAVSEALAAMDDIAVEDPAAVVEEIGTTWALTHLPLTFTPRRPTAA